MNNEISPCVKLCKIDKDSGYCKGCFRTLEEISGWISYNYQEKMIVYKKIKERKTNSEKGKET